MLKTLQAWTGLFFATFLALHLVSTFVAPLGAETFDAVQRGLQTYYQFAPLEALLLAAGATHAVIGVMRMRGEPKRELSRRAWWHRASAIFLLVFIVGHVLAVRGPSWVCGCLPRFCRYRRVAGFCAVLVLPLLLPVGRGGLLSHAERRLDCRAASGFTLAADHAEPFCRNRRSGVCDGACACRVQRRVFRRGRRAPE